MSIQERDGLLVTPSSRLRYEPRWFSSKRGLLILVCTILVYASQSSLNVYTYAELPKDHQVLNIVFAVLQHLIWLLSAVVSGWLADISLGRYKTVQVGLVLMWVGKIMMEIEYLVSFSIVVQTQVIMTIRFLGKSVVYIGNAAFQVNIIQLGIEQMPDASTEQITAIISWFVICSETGLWISALLTEVLNSCLPGHVLSKPFFDVVFLSLTLCCIFILKNWFLEHFQTCNPVKTMYQVLKYAKQHKYPVNRSAFTYWEEEIPSRIDLGKSKYGGPFTTEQVEDVKTCLRLLIMITISFLYVFLPNLIGSKTFNVLCSKALKFGLRSQHFTTAIFGIVYEVLIYAFFKKRIPSMLKRIGAGILLNIVLSASLLIGSTTNNERVIFVINSIKINLIDSVFTYVLLTSLLEFIYAQSPESMKGLLMAYMWSVTYLSLFVAKTLSSNSLWKSKCNSYTCDVVLKSIVTFSSIIVFIIHCIVARWYKMRVREEPYHTQTAVEEIYNRYVEHNQTSQEREH